MKKSLTILMCLAGIGAAQNADFTLTSSDVTFGTGDTASTELTESNAAMSWDNGTDQLQNWFIKFSITFGGTTDGASITTGDNSSSAPSGLSAYVCKSGSTPYITFGNGKASWENNPALSFTQNNTLTFSYNNNKAYLGNLATGSYSYCTPSDINTTINTTMTSGTSRAWSNDGGTQIGATTIASLEGSGYTAADMAVLMMTGAAPTENGTGDKKCYICTSGTTTAWSDDVGYTVGDSGVVTSTTSFENFTYYKNEEEAMANKTKTLILDLGDAKNGQMYDLGGVDFTNGVMNATGEGLSGYPADDDNASPKTYSYGILKLTDNANVNLGKIDASGTSKTNIWSSIGSLQLGDGAKLTLDQRKLIVSGLPYTSLGLGAEIVIKATNDKNEVKSTICFGLTTDSVNWDNLKIYAAKAGVDGQIINTSTDSEAGLGTETAGYVAFKDIVVEVNGASKKTVAAQMSNVSIFDMSSGDGGITVTGEKVAGSERAIREIRAGDVYTKSGGVTLLNRKEPVQLETLIIGVSSTVKAVKEDNTAALVKIDAYNSAIDGTSIISYLEFNGLHSYQNSTLDADLELGTGSKTDAVILNSSLAKFAKGETEAGYGLNMSGNDVTLKQGIVLNSWLFYEDASDGDEILLFSNVGNLNLLNLSGLIETATGVSVEDEIAASLYFSSDVSPYDYFGSVADPTGEKGNMTGWFIDYRLDEEDQLGDVYLTYKMGLTIPEPTTATMSLLALAALAARRRRR